MVSVRVLIVFLFSIQHFIFSYAVAQPYEYAKCNFGDTTKSMSESSAVIKYARIINKAFEPIGSFSAKSKFGVAVNSTGFIDIKRPHLISGNCESYTCSGARIDENHFLTAYHCLEEEQKSKATAMLYTANKNSKLQKESFIGSKINIKLVESNKAEDWAVFEFSDGSVFSDLDLTKIKAEQIIPDARLSIIHHPFGDYKMLSTFGCKVVDVKDTEIEKKFAEGFAHVCGTNGGSSGAPIFNVNWEIVGIHTASIQGINRGISIQKIATQSKIVAKAIEASEKIHQQTILPIKDQLFAESLSHKSKDVKDKELSLLLAIAGKSLFESTITEQKLNETIHKAITPKIGGYVGKNRALAISNNGQLIANARYGGGIKLIITSNANEDDWPYLSSKFESTAYHPIFLDEDSKIVAKNLVWPTQYKKKENGANTGYPFHEKETQLAVSSHSSAWMVLIQEEWISLYSSKVVNKANGEEFSIKNISGLSDSEYADYFSFLRFGAVSNNGRYVATGYGDVDLFTISDGQIEGRIISVEETSLGSVAFSPKSNLLAAGGGNGNIYLWDINNFEQIPLLTIENQSKEEFIPFIIAFDAAGENIISMDYKSRIMVYNLENKSHSIVYQGDFEVSHGAISSNGSWITFNSNDSIYYLSTEIASIEDDIEKACRLVSRDFTLGEWNTYFGEIERINFCNDN